MAGSDRGELWRGSNLAWGVIGTMLSGILVWGGVGWLLDRWLGFEGLFLPVGMVLGVGVAIWLIYIRHGRDTD